jgi:[ribosomal protein S5]-alanine N-acetyltransferase
LSRGTLEMRRRGHGTPWHADQPHCGVGVLELCGQRVVLRDFTPEDASAVLAYHSDPEVMRFLPAVVRGNQTLDAVQALLREASEDASRVPRLRHDLAVTLAGDVVGAARLHLGIDRAEGEVGYILRRDVWGSGVGTETAGLLVSYGFTELELGRLWATVDQRNVVSMRVLEKAGMRLAGALDRRRQLAEGRDTSVVYLLQRSEWDGPNSAPLESPH